MQFLIVATVSEIIYLGVDRAGEFGAHMHGGISEELQRIFR